MKTSNMIRFPIFFRSGFGAWEFIGSQRTNENAPNQYCTLFLSENFIEQKHTHNWISRPRSLRMHMYETPAMLVQYEHFQIALRHKP